MNHFIFSAVLTSVLGLFVSFYLLRLRSKIGRITAIYWFSIGFWAFFVASQSYTINLLSPFWWGWFLHLGCTFIPVLLFHFSLRITKNSEPIFQKALLFSYAITILFNVLNLLTNFFTSGTAYRDAYAYPVPALTYPLYFLLFVVLVIVSTFLLVRYLPSLQPLQKRGLKLLLISQVLAYLGGMDNFFIMADIRFFPIYPYGLYLVPPYALATLYTTLRYQLIR